MNINELLEKAKINSKHLPKKKQFVLKELFEGYEWESIPKGERIIFGKIFKNQVLEGKIKDVRFVERKKNNHSKYEKYN